MATSIVNFLFDMAVKHNYVFHPHGDDSSESDFIDDSNYHNYNLSIVSNNGKTSMPNRSSKKVCSN